MLLFASLTVSAQETASFDPATTFLAVLPPEQAATLAGERDLSVLVRALNPAQKAAVGAKLKEAESQTTDPAALADIHRAYLALKDATGAWRIGEALATRYPNASMGFTMMGQGAELRGDMAVAAAQAAEALRRDPNDRAAHALLKLTEGRISATGSRGAEPSRPAISAPSDPESSSGDRASPEALGLILKAAETLESGDAAKARIFAQEAMNLDPKSAVIRDYFNQIQDGSAALRQKEVGLYAAIRRREEEARSFREAADDLAAARRAAQRRRVPPLLPLGAGSVLLTLGVMAWNHGGRDEAEKTLIEGRRLLSGGLIVVGCAGVAYGIAGAIFGAASAAGPPAAALVAGPALSEGAVVVAPAVAHSGTAIASGGFMAGAGYSLAKSGHDDLPESTKHGSERFSDLNPTRGGVLSTQEAAELKQSGRVLNQKGGGKVYLREVEPGKFDVYVENEAGKPITSFRHIRLNKLQNLARNYGRE